MLRVKNITRTGDLTFTRLMAGDYSRLRRDYIDNFGITLPSGDKLNVKKDRDLRLLDNTVTITIELKKGGSYRYIFRKGWIHDTASVPPALRGFVDNDDRRLVLSAMVHDAHFRGHWLSFIATNRLFRKMALEADYPRWKSVLAWLSVSSPVGVFMFRRHRRKDKVGEYRKWVHFSKIPA